MTDATPRNPIIVTEFQGQSRGLIVHDVSDIVSIDADTVQRPEGAAQDHIINYMEGVAPLAQDMVMILDLEKLMSGDQLELAA